MEESYHHHHHHHHHHGHEAAQGESNGSNQQVQTTLETNQQQNAQVSAQQTSGGIQGTRSFHSVSSLDSSAEMAKYFPDAQTPSLSPFSRHHQEGDSQTGTTSKATAVTDAGPYVTVPAPTAVQQPLSQSFGASQQQQQQQQFQTSAASQLLSGIPSYSSQIEGLSVSQAVVNDVLVDLQAKVINETQQQYYEDQSGGNNFMEAISPIYIRAPNPTIILRSDLHRLRAELKARPQVVARHIGAPNQFQGPSFPPPQQHHSSESHAEYRNTTYAQT